MEAYAGLAKVPFAAFSFAGCIFFMCLSFANRDPGPEREQTKVLPWLAIVFAAAAFIRIVLYPHNAGVMNDEYYIAQSARQMIDPAFTPANNLDIPRGWPFIVSLFFWAGGPNQYSMFYANSLMGCLSVAAMFFLVYGISGRLAAAVVASAFLALDPLHSIWSICGAENVTSVFFMLVSVAGLFWFFRFHRPEYIHLSLYAASFAAQTSAENLMLFLLIPSGLFFFARELFVPRNIARSMALPILLVLPETLRSLSRMLEMTHITAPSDTFPKSSLAGDILDNLSSHIALAAAPGEFFLVILAFAASGLLFGLRKDSRPIIFFAVIAAAYFFASNSFSAPSTHSARFLLHSEMALIVIGSFCVKTFVERSSRRNLAAIAAGVVLPSVISFGFHMRNASPDFEYFQYGKEITQTIDWINAELPKGSALIAGDPAPYQFSTKTGVITTNLAEVFREELFDFGKLYFIVDISAREVSPYFCEIMEIQMVRPIEVDNPPATLCGLEYGVYSVSKFKSPSDGG